MKWMKFNPGFLTDEQLVASFCVRRHEFESIIEMLREDDSASSRHRLVIGPRGSGKTTLLLRVGIEIKNNSELSKSFFPVVFSEESYGVKNAADFWLEAASRTAEQAPNKQDQIEMRQTLEELRGVLDNATLERRCLATLLEFSHRQDKRLVLLVENLDMMFMEIADEDAGWHLRQTLQTEPRILLIATANSRFDDIDNPERAFYDLFATRQLPPLNQAECAALWESVSGQRRPPKAMRGLEILTGGNPRLLSIIARFGSEMSFRNLMADLLALIDDLTDYFKNHIEAIPPQERQVYLALADLWQPSTAREVSDRARLDTSKCSAFLKRLIGRGIVDSVDGTENRRLYRITQRLFNIYYLLRSSRAVHPLVHALVQFMDAYYSTDELQDLAVRMLSEARGLAPELLPLHRVALRELMKLPALAPHYGSIVSGISIDEQTDLFERSDLLEKERGEPIALKNTEKLLETQAPEDAALDALGARIREGLALDRSGDVEEAIEVWDQAVRNYGNRDDLRAYIQVARAIYLKALALGRVERHEEQIEAFGLIASSFNKVDDVVMQGIVALALVDQGAALLQLNSLQQARDLFELVRNQYASGQTAILQAQVARATFLINVIAAQGGNFSDALSRCDQLIDEIWQSEEPEVTEQLFNTLVLKADIFKQLAEPSKAVAAYDEIVRRFEEGSLPHELAAVGQALIWKASLHEQLGLRDQVISVCEDIYERFAGQEDPSLLAYAVEALARKGFNLGKKGLLNQAIEVFDEIIRRYEGSKEPKMSEQIATAFFLKGEMLCELDRPQKAIRTFEELDAQFGQSSVQEISVRVAEGLIRMALELEELERLDEEIEVLDKILHRYGGNSSPEMDVYIARALLCKGHALERLPRTEGELDCYDEIFRRFDLSKNPQLAEIVARALLLKGNSLQRKTSHSEAIATFLKLKARCGDSTTPEMLSLLAQALFNEAGSHFELEEFQKALATCNEILERFGESENSEIRSIVADTLLNKSVLLFHLKRSAEARAVHEELNLRFGGDDNPSVLAQVATSHISVALKLLEEKRTNDALHLCAEVINRFAGRDMPALELAVANALFIKGNIYFDTRQYRDAIKTFEEMAQSFATANELELQVLVVRALNGKAGALFALDEREKALTVCDELFSSYAASPSSEIRQIVAVVLVERGRALIQMDRPEEAYDSFGEAINLIGNPPSEEARDLLFQTLVYRAQVLQLLGRFDHAAEVWDELLEQFDNRAASSISHQVTAAYRGKASLFAANGKFEDAVSECSKAVRRIESDLSGHHEVDLVKLMVIKGACLGNLGREAAADEALRYVVERFGDKDDQEFQTPVVAASLQLAENERDRGNYQESLVLLERAIGRLDDQDEATKCHCYLVRAHAHLGAGNLHLAEQDIQSALSLGSIRTSILGIAVTVLIDFAVVTGIEQALNLVEQSPCRKLLFPLAVAFKKELGEKIRVPEEIEQVADDIQKRINGHNRGEFAGRIRASKQKTDVNLEDISSGHAHQLD